MKDSFRALVTSRKFLLMWLGIVLDVVTFLATKHLAPDQADEVIKLLAVMQPGIVAVILGIAHEDAAGKKIEPQRREGREGK